MAAFWPAGPEPIARKSNSYAASAIQLLPHELADHLGVCLALRPLHHLADEEAEQPLLTAPVRIRLGGMRGEQLVDDRPQLRDVGQGGLAEVALRSEVGIARVGERL